MAVAGQSCRGIPVKDEKGRQIGLLGFEKPKPW